MEDEKYKQILESMQDKEKEVVMAYMERHMKAWQEDLFNPLEKLMENKEFVDAISNNRYSIKV